jgi:hypothetical protein
MGLFHGMYKVNDASGKTILKGMMDRGFTAITFINHALQFMCRTASHVLHKHTT